MEKVEKAELSEGKEFESYLFDPEILAAVVREKGKFDFLDSVLELAEVLTKKAVNRVTRPRNPAAIPATCLYFAGILTGDRLTMNEAATAFGTGPNTIKEILKDSFFDEIGSLIGCCRTRTSWHAQFKKHRTYKNLKKKIKRNAEKLLDSLNAEK